MPAFCGVFHCRNRSARDRKSFFRVPAVISKGEEIKKLSLNRREKWLAVLRWPDLNEERNKWLRVCEDHFITGRPADLFDVENPDWIPSLNLGTSKRKKMLSSVNIPELSSESSTSDSSFATSQETESVSKQSVACQTDFTVDDLRAMENAYADTIRELIEVRDKVSKLSIHEDAFKDNNLKTKNYTGIPTYGMLMTIFEMLEKDLTHYSASTLTKFQRYMLTLMRLRLNLDLNDLARRFCVSKSTVLKAFQTTINIMYQKFENIIVWPDRDIKKEPESTEETEERKVSVIVNTFEIITNKPQHAKHANTKKFLIGIHPQGRISFISSSYEGNTPDETILQRCGILEKLLPGDVVVCDKGVSIHDDYTEDADEDLEMGEQNKSDFHRHAEKVINRLKKYTFLQRTMPTTALSSSNPEVPPLLDQVVKVCCCLINITSLVDPFDIGE